MSKINVVLLVCLILVLQACSVPDNAFRDQYRWLSGKWIAEEDGVTKHELWKWNRYRFEGEAFDLKDGDTIFKEQLFLEDYGGIPAYSAVINGSGPFTFGMKETDGELHVFENADHDFPSQIIYRRDSDSSMTITLIGKDAPQEAEISYQMIRVK